MIVALFVFIICRKNGFESNQQVKRDVVCGKCASRSNPLWHFHWEESKINGIAIKAPSLP